MNEVHLNIGEITAVVNEHVDDAVDRALDAGAAYWESHARRDTGLMARSTTEVNFGSGRGGELTVDTTTFGAAVDYAPFQEYGTRYIRGMHLTADIERVMAEAAGRDE